MPLIIITGTPSSGKSCRAKEIGDYLRTKDKKVLILSEYESVLKANYNKNEYFKDSQKEKQIRSDLKSEAVRLLNKDDVIILDGGNYIKGYRYELFCASKAARTTQCTLYTAITKDHAWEFNENRTNDEEKYTKEIFDALIMRYEEPQHSNRWDSPLFTVFPEEELDLEKINSVLFENKALVPNLSTQNPPLSSTNYLFEMDKITHEIIEQILSARKIGVCGGIQVKGVVEPKVDIPSDMNACHLNRSRRQFLNYMKSHTTNSCKLDKIPAMFVQFLNSNCK